MLSKNPVLKGVSLAVLMTFFGSTGAAATKLVAGTVSVEQIVLIQAIICLLCVLPQCSPKALRIEPEDRIAILIRGLAGLFGFYALYEAIRYIPLIEAILLRNASPLFVPLLAFLWLGTRSAWHNLLAIAIGFVGVYFVLGTDLSTPGPGHMIGLSAGFFLALSMVSTNRLAGNYKPGTILFYYYAISILGMLPFAFNSDISLEWQGIVALLYVGFVTHIALVLYTKALTLAKATIIAPITYLSVVNAGIIGWLVWDEIPSQSSIIGMCLVICAGIMTSLLSARRPQ